MSSPNRPPHAAAPQSYIVRVYRRDPRLAGTIEQVGSGSERGFNGVRELEALLAAPSPAPTPGPAARSVPLRSARR